MRLFAISYNGPSPPGLERLEEAGFRLISKHTADDTCFAILTCPSPDPRLTPRQVEVVHLMAQGLSPAEVAATLGISRKTVERHLRHSRQRLSVTNDVQLGAAVERLGL